MNPSSNNPLRTETFSAESSEELMGHIQDIEFEDAIIAYVENITGTEGGVNKYFHKVGYCHLEVGQESEAVEMWVFAAGETDAAQRAKIASLLVQEGGKEPVDYTSLTFVESGQRVDRDVFLFRKDGGAWLAKHKTTEVGPSDGGNPDVNDVNARIFGSVLGNVNKLSSKEIEGTDAGNLGCAWAVNEVVRRALGNEIGGGLSTVGLRDALTEGRRGKAIDESAATPGTIIISPTIGNNHGHVGIVGKGRDVYSNSSNDGIFERNWNIDRWKKYYEGRGLKVLFFDVVS